MQLAEEGASSLYRFRSASRFGGRVLEARPGPDVVRIIETLVRHRVRFILIGGLAGNVHGSPRLTLDFDMCYARDRENLQALAAVLEELRARLRGAPPDLPDVIDAVFLRNGDHFTFATDAGDFDCLGTPAGTSGFDDLARSAEPLDVGGRTVLVASLSDLIRMKRAAGRPKDMSDIETLGALQEVVDEERRRNR
jgi:hypothetical protein